MALLHRMARMQVATSVRIMPLLALALVSGCAAASDDTAEQVGFSTTPAEPKPTEPTDPEEPDPIFGGQEISLAQHTSWTIEAGAPKTYRVVAYGDSIFAGYQRSIFSVARRAAPWVAGEYLSHRWGANIEVVRRTVSGAVSSEVAANMDSDKSYMADPSTRAVYFEMCGNDYLQARKRFASDSGTCDLSDLDAALAGCVRNMEKAMMLVNTAAPTAKQKAIANLYYPGFDADDVQSRCTNAAGARVNIQKTLLPYMARSNWNACTLARRHGFGCVDSFAEYMGADYDSNGDGKIDSDALRFDPNESEAAYVERITVRLRSTVRDSNKKGLTPTTTADYLFTDDTHPTYHGNTIGTGSGRGPRDFTAAQIVNGKNPVWNQLGHERMGYSLARLAPAAP